MDLGQAANGGLAEFGLDTLESMLATIVNSL